MAEGWKWRNDREWERSAWEVAHLINISGRIARQRVTPKRLLKPEKSQQELESQWDELARRLEKRNGS